MSKEVWAWPGVRVVPFCWFQPRAQWTYCWLAGFRGCGGGFGARGVWPDPGEGVTKGSLGFGVLIHGYMLSIYHRTQPLFT